MIVAIGSKNPSKIQALEEVLKTYKRFENAKVIPVSVDSGVSEQPFSLEEIILGAKTRAKNAFEAVSEAKFGFGMESGLFPASGTSTGYLESSICSIYDGKKFHIGLSCGFEIPEKVLQLILDQNIDLNKACYNSGVTKNRDLGSSEGLIGLLTQGRIDRKTYAMQGIITAMIQLENSHLY